MGSSNDETNLSESSTTATNGISSPNYMKATTSSSARKASYHSNSGGLLPSPESKTRIYSSITPIHKISMDECLDGEGGNMSSENITPDKSLQQGVDRATCSSTLRQSEFHVCSYKYCSLNGHRHHAPSPPLKEFISARRQALNNRKYKQPTEDGAHMISTPQKYPSTQKVLVENHTAQAVVKQTSKKWTIEGNISNVCAAFSELSDEQTSATDYDQELTPAPSRNSQRKRWEESLKKDAQEPGIEERDEALKLVQEAINELLTLSEQEVDDRFSDTSVTSTKAVCHQTLQNVTQTETLADVIATLEDANESPRENGCNTYSKLSKVITCKRFIEAMKNMRQFKLHLQSPHDIFQSTDLEEAEGTPSLRPTTSEEKSWQDWMLDYALQQVIARLAPAQKRRVTLLVQAFETVGSQLKQTTEQIGKVEIS